MVEWYCHLRITHMPENQFFGLHMDNDTKIIWTMTLKSKVIIFSKELTKIN